MKFPAAIAALLALGTLAFPVSLRADTISATVTTNDGVQTISRTPILNEEVSDYIHLDTNFGASPKTFNKPQDAPSNSPAPEPGSLCLMATGLFGAASVLRRKFSNT
jgi:hypothetical protein